MATPEPEQYIGQGNEIAWWIFTWKNVAGMVIGGYTGSSLGETIGGVLLPAGVSAMILAALGVLLGYILTRKTKGLMRVRRIGQAAWFYAMSLISLPVIDAATCYGVSTDDDDDPLMWATLMEEEGSR